MRCLLFSQLFFLIFLLDRALLSQSLTCKATQIQANPMGKKRCPTCTCSGNICMSVWEKRGSLTNMSTWIPIKQACSTRNPFGSLPDNRCIMYGTRKNHMRCQCNTSNCNSVSFPAMKKMPKFPCHNTTTTYALEPSA